MSLGLRHLIPMIGFGFVDNFIMIIAGATRSCAQAHIRGQLPPRPNLKTCTSFFLFHFQAKVLTIHLDPCYTFLPWRLPDWATCAPMFSGWV